MLVRPVEIAGDGAGADIGALADGRIAEIGEVIGLGLRRDGRAVHLDEIADMDLLADAALRPDAGEGPEDGAGRNAQPARWE